MRASGSQMAGALVLLAGAAALPTRAYLTSQAGALAPDQLSGHEGAVDHTARSRHLASSDESRGAEGISSSDARPHDLERRDNTPAEERCSRTSGPADTCPAIYSEEEVHKCNRHYCASCRTRAPAPTPHRPWRQVCVECALHVYADCKGGSALVCRNNRNDKQRCYLKPTYSNLPSYCSLGVLSATTAETNARAMCELLHRAETKACADQNFERSSECAKALQERPDDEAFVRAAALRINTQTLQFASDRLKADKDFMLTFISDFKLGLALKYASDALKGDVEFATLAVRNAGESHVVKVLKLCEEQIRDRHNTATWQGLWV